MQARMGGVMGVAAGVVVFAALAYPAMWVELLVRRELYRGFEGVGIMDPSGALGGQILGFNYQREPEWSHRVIHFIGACVAFGPGVIGALLVMRRVSGAGRETLCGCCGGALRGATEARCPGCGAGFGERGRGGRYRRDGGVRWWVVRRLAAALVCFGVVSTWVDRVHGWTVQSWIIELGEATGQDVMWISGRHFTGDGGPFIGNGAGTRAWNVAWRHSIWVSAAGAGLAGAMAAFGACSAGALGRSRVFGYRGRTRCGGCGYALEGLREMRCPECGREI